MVLGVTSYYQSSKITVEVLQNPQVKGVSESVSEEEVSKSVSEDCRNAQNIGEFDDHEGPEYIVFCDESINLKRSGGDSWYATKSIEDIDSFYDLFQYVNPEGRDAFKDFPTIKVVEVFPASNPKFIAIQSIVDAGLTYRTAIGIYIVQDGTPVRVFRKGFREIPGRWIYVELANSSATFSINRDFGALGVGANVMEWEDFYTWNSANEKFEVDNVSHKREFEDLLSKYDEMNDRGCSQSVLSRNEQHTGFKLSELYENYPGVDTYCDEEVGIKRGTVTTFLDARDTILEILKGIDLNSNDVL